jgi:hypothetical protein
LGAGAVARRPAVVAAADFRAVPPRSFPTGSALGGTASALPAATSTGTLSAPVSPALITVGWFIPPL